MKFKLSARDKEESDIKYDDKDFNPESKLNFSTEFTVSNLALTIWDLGYHDVESITKQLKERNIPMDAKAKEIIKAVVEKMEAKTETASWKSYLKKTASVQHLKVVNNRGGSGYSVIDTYTGHTISGPHDSYTEAQKYMIKHREESERDLNNISSDPYAINN